MTFISYAQNFEDVMLWRALKGIENGFYIDVGAWSHQYDSVTRAFYDRGWRGINIEPNQDFYQEYLLHRVRDINLCLAVSDKPGLFKMNFLEKTGLSTFDTEIAEKHIKAGWRNRKEDVRVTTLLKLWEDYVPVGQQVHFLKVDVEGFEKHVLFGNDWGKNRPWVLIVESTLPMSQEENYEEWESILLSSRYRFVYADGLNRFYLAEEHSDLAASFKYPPNCFDDFKLLSLDQAEERIRQEENRAQAAEYLVQEAEEKIDVLLASTSWKITRPLRAVMAGLSSIIRRNNQTN